MFVTIFAFILTFLVVYVAGLMLEKKGNAVSSRIREISSSEEMAPATIIEPEIRSDMLPTVTQALSGRKLTESLYTELSAAGLPIRPSEFIAIELVSVILPLVFVFMLKKDILIASIVFLIGASMPIMVLRILQKKRRDAFNGQIADTLTMISSSLKAGFSLLRSMQIVAQEMPDPIASEFDRVINEVNVGKPVAQALRSSVGRMKSYDFDLAVTAIDIQHQVGGNLAEILEIISSTIRERVRIIAEMRALTAEGRLSGVILVMMPIIMAIVIYVLHPTYIMVLIKENIGHYLIGFAVIMQALGALIINKMLSFDF